MSPLLLGPHENESTFHPPVSPEMIHRPVWFIGHTVDDGPSSLYCGLYTQDRQQLVNLIINPLVSNHEYEIHFCSDAEATSDADSSLQKKCRRSFFKKKKAAAVITSQSYFFFFLPYIATQECRGAAPNAAPLLSPIETRGSSLCSMKCFL